MPFYKLLLVVRQRESSSYPEGKEKKTLRFDITSLDQMTSLSIWLAYLLSQLFLEPKKVPTKLKQ